MIKKLVQQGTFLKILLFGIIISTVSLAGCTKDYEVELHKQLREKVKWTKGVPDLSFKGIVTKPISIEEGAFDKFVGWLTDQTLVYIINQHLGSKIYVHNLETGSSEIFYETYAPIVTVSISPSRNFMFIHSSPSTYQGLATVVNLNGEELFKQSIPSSELVYEWNPFNENLIAVTAFKEDWSYDSYILNIKENTLEKLELPEPFVVWSNENEVTYLDWDEGSPSFFGTLVSKEMDSTKPEIIMNDVFRFNVFKNVLMIITVKPSDGDETTYTFLNENMNIIKSFKLPHLTTFSNWLVPEYYYLSGRKAFLTFRPLSSGAADFYTGSFQLVEYSLDTGEEKILLNNINNEPLNCSPNGLMCLYGYQLNKLLILEEKAIIDLVQ